MGLIFGPAIYLVKFKHKGIIVALYDYFVGKVSVYLYTHIITMSLPQTPGGAGPSQPFRALEFGDPTPRAVVPAVTRHDMFSGSESTNNANDDMSDSDTPVTAHSYHYQMITSPDELSRGACFLESFRPRTRPATITSGRRSNQRTDQRPSPPTPAPEIP